MKEKFSKFSNTMLYMKNQDYNMRQNMYKYNTTFTNKVRHH